MTVVEFAAEEDEEVFWAKGADPKFTKRLLAGLEGAVETRKGIQVKMDIEEIVDRSMIQR